jgi:hypothetical protein
LRQSSHFHQIEFADGTPATFTGRHTRPELLVEPEPALVEVGRLANHRQLGHGRDRSHNFGNSGKRKPPAPDR